MQKIPFLLIIVVIGVLGISALVGILVLWVVVHHALERAHLQDLEAAKSNSKNELLSAQLELQEETFQHVGREIHDNIGQYLSLVKLHLNRQVPDLPPNAQEKIQYVLELVSNAIQDLRDLSKSLGGDIIREQGLCKAIEQQVALLENANHYKVTFDMLGVYNYLEEEKEIILYRILQEAINNVIRHSRARSIHICLDFTHSSSITMSIADDGAGFDISRYSSHAPERIPGGIGNMSVRAKVINAEFGIQSSPGEGTQLKIVVPYTPDI